MFSWKALVAIESASGQSTTESLEDEIHLELTETPKNNAPGLFSLGTPD
jgi:hypothetical protein